MKKILAAFVALVILSCTVLSMVSCGSVDIDELVKSLESNGAYETDEYESEGLDASIVLKAVRISSNKKNVEDEEELVVVEYVSQAFAEISYKMQKIQNDNEEAEIELYKDMIEAYEEAGIDEDVDYMKEQVEDYYETVVKLKGTVLIYGSKAIYDDIF